MPIYEYRCNDCGQHKDYLQKISDAPIDACPSCGSKAFAKALTAAGFQLKGSGWYATDFKGGATKSTETSTSAAPAAADAATTGSTTESSAKSESTGGGSCTPGCACH